MILPPVQRSVALHNKKKKFRGSDLSDMIELSKKKKKKKQVETGCVCVPSLLGHKNEGKKIGRKFFFLYLGGTQSCIL